MERLDLLERPGLVYFTSVIFIAISTGSTFCVATERVARSSTHPGLVFSSDSLNIVTTKKTAISIPHSE
jgi:hypothetical protein